MTAVTENMESDRGMKREMGQFWRCSFQVKYGQSLWIDTTRPHILRGRQSLSGQKEEWSNTVKSLFPSPSAYYIYSKRDGMDGADAPAGNKLGQLSLSRGFYHSLVEALP